MRSLLLTAALCGILLASCGGSNANSGANSESVLLKAVTLPNGKVVKVEVLLRREDMMRGMMHRTTLAEDRGLLFVHGRPGRNSYWMHNVRVPLDIIWMDRDHKIVELSLNTPGCLDENPVNCPHYGGKADSMFVLELAGGVASKNGLSVGQALSF